LSKLKFLRNISNKERYLIDYSNLKEGIFPYQNLNSNKNIVRKIINLPDKGIPILFPPNLSFFEYDEKFKIKINNSIIMKKVFLTKNQNYLPYNNFIKNGETFFYSVKVRYKYKKIINEISSFNKNSIHQIRKINDKYKETCSFQTRNIPHLGHEKIIKSLLEKFDHVIINPLIGPKKNGDVRFEILKRSYDYIIKNKFQNRLSYVPIIANMFYAGPREALHHANIRKSLGFKNFAVGRDHAGAFDNYGALDAYKLVLKYKKKLKINIVNLKGAYYCNDCKNIILNFSCKHNNYKNISGTEFRKKLECKKLFVFADKKLQKKLHNFNKKLFV